MANPDRLREAFSSLVDAAELDARAPRQPRDERIAFPPEQLHATWRLLQAPADYERAMLNCDDLMHEMVSKLDERRALAALKLIEKLEAAGVRREYREGEQGLQPST